VSENKSLCSYPWRGACIYPTGLVKPCCYWLSANGNINEANSNIKNDPRNSAEWNKIREDMLAGNPVKGCEKCQEMESVGNHSGRLSSLYYLVPTENKLAPLEDLEVSFSNLCNLACVGCGDFNSTKWSTENIKAGRPGMKLIDNKFDWAQWDLSNLKTLKILGGEPFMEPDRFCELLESVNLSQIELVVNTNGTILPNQRLKALIEKCKQVKFLVSIDGIGLVNDWNRWPGKFQNIVEAMNVYETWWKYFDNITLKTHSVVNIFNIFTMEDFINFMKKDFPSWTASFMWVNNPGWQSIQALPQEVKTRLINEFSSKDVGDLQTSREDFFKLSIGYLKINSTVEWKDVKRRVASLASERNLDTKVMIPDLQKVINDF
jgi:sulfatase maturation enzyme AslB (radical SAM superfamily)